ncbi:hypothetical protein SNE40_020839 [Patella caerulea]|uniref:Uncharacterized protein n=1 Tax=Patella caerulea TaxID=87958 RepID=A0AAN8J773_PATCE
MGNSYKLQSGFRILSDLPEVMKKEHSRLSTIAFKLRKENYLKTRIRDSGTQMILETRKTKEDRWTIHKTALNSST